VLVLILVLIDAETNANPSFNLRMALRVFSVAWHGLNLKHCCAQSGT
jgi:hypothetical protein